MRRAHGRGGHGATTRGGRAAAGAALAALALGAAATPPARAAATAGAAYGGGALTPAAPLVDLRVSPAPTRISFEGEAIARCARGAPVDERLTVGAPLAASGSFRGLATRTYRLSATETRTVRLIVAGRVIDAQRASGVMRIAVSIRRPRQAAVRCDSQVQRWQSRAPGAIDPAPGPPLAGAGYYGRTLQRLHYLPFPFALRVSTDGTRVDTALFRVYRRCRGVASDEVPNDMPPAGIQPDGSFSVTQRYSQRFPDSIEYFTFVLSGRFSAGGVGGTLRATSFARDPRTRRVIGHCDSGSVAWRAIL